MAKIPGSKLPRLWQTLCYYKDPYRFLMRQKNKYGDVFSIRIKKLPKVVVINHPEHIKQVFSAPADVCSPGKGTVAIFPSFFGLHSIIAEDGEAHMEHRKIILPHLNTSSVEGYKDQLTQSIEANISKWAIGTTINVSDELRQTTIDCILGLLYGPDKGFTEELKNDMLYNYTIAENPTKIFMQALFPKLSYFLFSYFYKFNDIMLNLNKEKKNTQNPDGLIRVYLQAKFKNGEALDDETVLDETATLVLAGQGTTEAVLCWAVYYILNTPGVYENLMLSFENCSDQSIASLTQSVYLDCILKETLRLRPVSPIPWRWVEKPIPIGEYIIEKDNIIMLSSFLTQQREDEWDSPELFIPTRFMELNTAKTIYSYYPFGVGVRHCVGSLLAMLEMKITLASIFSKYRIEMDTKGKVKATTKYELCAPTKNFSIRIVEELKK